MQRLSPSYNFPLAVPNVRFSHITMQSGFQCQLVMVECYKFSLFVVGEAKDGQQTAIDIVGPIRL